MRNILMLILSLSFFTLNAQQKVEISEGIHAMSKGSLNAFSMKIEAASSEFILGKWRSYIKKYKGKTKYNKKMQEVFSDNAKIKEMSDNTIDVYARVVGSAEEGNLELLVWFNLGAIYLSSKDHPDRVPAAIQLLEDFMGVIEIDLIKNAIKEEKKSIKEEQKALKSLEKAIAKFEKIISKYEAEIEKIQQKIKLVEEDKTKVVEESTAQKTKIEDKEKNLQDLEQTLKSLKRR